MRTRNIIILVALLALVAGAYYYLSRPEEPEPEDPKVYVWDIEDSELAHITINLPQHGKSESFVKISEGDKFPWYFDDEENTPVDSERWGGGIPLLLSGPGADRVIAREATPEQLKTFGFENPRMIIELTLQDGEEMTIEVGDPTPDGENYYVKAPGSNGVATVDFTWYGVLASLVLDPPYVEQSEE